MEEDVSFLLGNLIEDESQEGGPNRAVFLKHQRLFFPKLC